MENNIKKDDYYAGQAMRALIEKFGTAMSPEMLANKALEYSDAMIDAQYKRRNGIGGKYPETKDKMTNAAE